MCIDAAAPAAMRAWWLAAILVLVASCSNGTTPSAQVTPSSSPAPTTTTAACQPSTTNYGLILAAGNLQVIDTCAGVKASTQIAAGSMQLCTTGGLPANLEPPVSATSDRIYYRDGDTKIRYLALDGSTGTVTSVPGTASEVSFFSVSPDDKRIAVLDEDAGDPSNLKLRLYVEDLQGGGNHLDLYSTSVPKATGNTLWPMGWHGGQLVLALIQACGSQPGGILPAEWHVVDPATGNRLVNIPCGSGTLSRWPSPGGVGCVNGFNMALYHWDGTSFFGTAISGRGNDVQTGLSPSGERWFVAGQTTGQYCPTFATPPSTCIQGRSGIVSGWVEAAGIACLFIDETHVLMPQGVIAADPGSALVAFPTAGTCAGRFPGGL